jgi:hypothetical protein
MKDNHTPTQRSEKTKLEAEQNKMHSDANKCHNEFNIYEGKTVSAACIDGYGKWLVKSGLTELSKCKK